MKLDNKEFRPFKVGDKVRLNENGDEYASQFPSLYPNKIGTLKKSGQIDFGGTQTLTTDLDYNTGQFHDDAADCWLILVV